MSLIENILQFSTISIIGTEKNTGKTETLNYILSQLRQRDISVALTSIGTDGEKVDAVTTTSKPEIELCANDLFVTTENYFKNKRCSAEILSISHRSTSLGRLVLSKAHTKGKCIISGPNTTDWLREVIDQIEKHHPTLTIIDGALSRKSSASPVIAEGIILATGAAFSLSIPEIVKNIQFLNQLMNFEKVDSQFTYPLSALKTGIYAIDNDQIIDIKIPSVLLIQNYKDKIFQNGHKLYVSGMITDVFFQFLNAQKEIENIEIWVKDFTRFFVSPLHIHQFLSKKGKIKLLFTSQLIAITVNPTSPNGYKLSSEELCQSIQKITDVQVFDVRR